MTELEALDIIGRLASQNILKERDADGDPDLLATMAKQNEAASLVQKMIEDRLEPLMKEGVEVEVPEPDDFYGDAWNNGFTGTIVRDYMDNNGTPFAVVRDAEDNHFDVEIVRLTPA